MNPAIQSAKDVLNQSKERILKTFAAVPDDKIAYSPAPGAKSPINLIVHCAFANHGISDAISGKTTTMPDMAEIHAMSRAEEAKVSDRAQAVAMLEESVLYAHKMLDGFPESRLGETGMMGMPMTWWIFLPGHHMFGHATQIDYIETCYGDMEDHM